MNNVDRKFTFAAHDEIKELKALIANGIKTENLLEVESNVNKVFHVLEVGNLDIELCSFQITPYGCDIAGINPDDEMAGQYLGYYCCVKNNSEWQSYGEIFEKVNTDTKDIEREMFLVLDKYAKEKGLSYSNDMQEHSESMNKNENKKIWLRLGISLDVPESQKLKITNGDEKALLDVLTSPGKENGEWYIDGDTYIPENDIDKEINFDLPVTSMTKITQNKIVKQEKELPVIDMKKLESTLRSSGFSNDEVQAIWHTVWDYSGDWLEAFDERYMKSVAVEDATADDRFYLNDNGRIEQLYYNPNGYGDEGQYVSDNYYWKDVLDAADHANGSINDFFDYFYEVAQQYLYDNDGSDTFNEAEAQFNGDKHDFMGCTEKTMNKLIAFAREQEKAALSVLDNQKQPEIKTGDFIEYDNKRWHVDYVSADIIQLTNLNPLDNDKAIHATKWKDHLKEYTVVDKSEIDMSTLKPKKQKPSLSERIEKGKEKVRESDKSKDKTIKPKKTDKEVVS